MGAQILEGDHHEQLCLAARSGYDQASNLQNLHFQKFSRYHDREVQKKKESRAVKRGSQKLEDTSDQSNCQR